MNNTMNDILKIKTRWGEIKSINYSFNYPVHQFYVCNTYTTIPTLPPNIELNIAFENKEGVIRIVQYKAINVSQSILFKQFIKNMRKKTDILFEDFPKTVEVGEVKFKICSINYR